MIQMMKTRERQSVLQEMLRREKETLGGGAEEEEKRGKQQIEKRASRSSEYQDNYKSIQLETGPTKELLQINDNIQRVSQKIKTYNDQMFSHQL